jgi:hypothetical protein
MSKSPSLSLSQPIDQAVAADPISIAIRVHALQMDFAANYEAHLEETVFNRSVDKVDAKDSRKYSRTLKSIEAYKILALLWKESSFVTEGALAAAGTRRQYSEKIITAHRLAADLADGAHQVSILNSRIRTIGIAAAAYGLVDRDAAKATNVPLRGTQILHDFMTGLSKKNLLLLADVVRLMDVPPGTDFTGA